MWEAEPKAKRAFVAQGDLIKGRRALGFAFGIPKVSEALCWMSGSTVSTHKGLLMSVSEDQGKVSSSRAEICARDVRFVVCPCSLKGLCPSAVCSLPG